MKSIMIIFVASLVLSCLAEPDMRRLERANCIQHPLISKVYCARKRSKSKHLQMNPQRSSNLDEQFDAYDSSSGFDSPPRNQKRLEQALRKRIAGYLTIHK